MSIFFGVVFALVPIVKAQNTLAHGSVSPIVIKTSNVHQYGVVSITEVTFVLPQSGEIGYGYRTTKCSCDPSYADGTRLH